MSQVANQSSAGDGGEGDDGGGAVQKLDPGLKATRFQKFKPNER